LFENLPLSDYGRLVESVADSIRRLPNLQNMVEVQSSPYPLPNRPLPCVLVTYGDEDFADALDGEGVAVETHENQIFISLQVNVWIVVDRKQQFSNKVADFIFRYRQWIRQVLHRPKLIDICHDCQIDLNPAFDEKQIPEGFFVSPMAFYYKILSDRIDPALIGVAAP